MEDEALETNLCQYLGNGAPPIDGVQTAHSCNHTDFVKPVNSHP